jgi:hypothetical protein
METLTTIPVPDSTGVRAPCSASPRDVVASPGTCPICGTALTGQQRSACSAKCRAALSRRLHIPVNREELQAIRATLRRTVEEAWQAQQLVEAALREG